MGAFDSGGPRGPENGVVGARQPPLQSAAASRLLLCEKRHDREALYVDEAAVGELEARDHFER